MSDAEWIFIDRYLSSHLVSQQVFGVHLKHLDPLFERLPKPSITLFLDLPVSTAIDRLHSRLDRKSHETYDHLQKAQQIYQRLAKKEHWLTLNALLTPDQLMKEAFNAIYIS
jgi:thymidylate kinase